MYLRTHTGLLSSSEPEGVHWEHNHACMRAHTHTHTFRNLTLRGLINVPLHSYYTQLYTSYSPRRDHERRETSALQLHTLFTLTHFLLPLLSPHLLSTVHVSYHVHKRTFVCFPVYAVCFLSHLNFWCLLFSWPVGFLSALFSNRSKGWRL